MQWTESNSEIDEIYCLKRDHEIHRKATRLISEIQRTQVMSMRCVLVVHFPVLHFSVNQNWQ